MKTPKPHTTLAQRYLTQPIGITNRIIPLRTDRLGRKVFPDGSHLTTNAAGQPIFGRYDAGEWLAQELSAKKLGLSDHKAWKKFRGEFRRSTAQYPARVCAAYRSGYFSVLPA